jgi:transposase
LKYTNKHKLEQVYRLVDEYRRVVGLIIDDLWDSSKETLNVPKFCDTTYLQGYNSWLSQRMKQACSKQAIAMLNSAYEKRRKQLFVLRKLQRMNANVKHLQSKIDRQPLVKPNCQNVNLELDSRFVDFDKSETETFLFIRLSSIGNKIQIKIPVKEHAISNKWMKLGQRKLSVRLSKSNINLMFDVAKSKNSGTVTVGADQGISTVLSFSDGQTTFADCHGHTLSSIQKRLSRRRKGSKGFKRTQEQRKNFINWSLNQLNFANIGEVRLEKIRNLGRGTHIPRFMSHWTRTLIKDKLTRLSQEEGFQLREVPNEFRSQRCSKCGWVRKVNRKGKTFKCSLCGFTHDADLNAASNLELDLFEVPYWVRQKKINLKGFYWKSDGLFSADQKPIVSDDNKRNDISF